MLAFIDPSAVPALRIAGTFFLILNLLFGWWLFRNRKRFLGVDPNVDFDISAVRYLRIMVVGIPWLFLTGRLAIMVISLG